MVRLVQRILRNWYWWAFQEGNFKLDCSPSTWMTLQRIMLGKKANPKRLYTIWFFYIMFLKWQSYRNGEQINGCHGQRRKLGLERSGCGYKMATWQIMVVMEMVCIWTLLITILATVYYSPARCYHRGKLGKGYIAALSVIPYNWM